MKALNMMRLRRKLIRKLLFGLILLSSMIGIFQIQGKMNNFLFSTLLSCLIKKRVIVIFFLLLGRCENKNYCPIGHIFWSYLSNIPVKIQILQITTFHIAVFFKILTFLF